MNDMIFRTRLLLLSMLLCAWAASAKPAENDDALRASSDRKITATDAFLNHHPDIKYRLLGLHAYGHGDPGTALSHFRHAAHYADKPAQSMLAEMLWNGEGVAMDRPLAYAWMDIAAERGYPTMVAFRERYWAQLDAAQRQDALTRGAALLRDYGDDIAKQRLERLLRQAKRNVTGSRTGFVGFLQIQIPTPSGMVTVDGEQFYADRYWKPEQYWRWQDQDWKKPGKGTVELGPLQPLREDDVPADQP